MSVARKCRKTKGCRGLGGHSGPCYNRKGKVIPAARPVETYTVEDRDEYGKPTRFRRLEVKKRK